MRKLKRMVAKTNVKKKGIHKPFKKVKGKAIFQSTGVSMSEQEEKSCIYQSLYVV